MRLPRHLLVTVALSAVSLTSVCALCPGAAAYAQTTLGAPSEPQTREPEDERLNEARALIYDGKYSEGMAILDGILAEKPDSRDALFLMGTAYEWQGQLEEAQKIFRTIVSVNENDLEAWEEVAKLDAWQGRHDEAIALYGKLISRFGDKPSLLVGLARALSWANRLDEALLYYDRVLLQEPENPDALAGKAQVLRWMGQTRAARKVISKAQSTSPSHPEVKKEAEQIKLDLSPKVTVSYLESLEEGQPREGSATYNLGDRTWKAEADFFPELLESVGLDFWSSRDWEVDRSLGMENYRVATLGFSASVGVPVGELGTVGGSFTVRAYDRYRENVLYPLYAEDTRVQDFEIWLSAKRGLWQLDATVGTYPYFHKAAREVPPIRKLVIGQQAIGRFQVSRNLTRTALATLGFELADYSERENDRRRVFGSVEGNPTGGDWMFLRYSIHYQDFDSTSRDYFAPMNEFNQKLLAQFSRSVGSHFFRAGVTLGQSHSSNFDDIFSVNLSGFASRNITRRWKAFVDGFKYFDDNDYSIGSIRAGFELTL